MYKYTFYIVVEIELMNEKEIYNRLNELSLYFSFGRVLGYIAFFETVGIEYQLKHGQDANKDRMLSSELNFLIGLWIQNVVLDKTWDIKLDDDFTREVYELMDDLHSSYLKKNDLSNQFIEVFFYEGDLAYDWQYAYFAQKKYNTPCLYDVLKNNFNFDITVLNTTLSKIKSCIEKQIKRRRQEKWKHHEYISPMNAFTIKPNIIKKKFSFEEQSVIKALSFRLGSGIDKRINKITDFNSYVQYPIIELPNNRGYFCVNECAISVAMNETPFYWLQSSPHFGKNLGSIRGDIAENLVLEIVQRRFQKNIFAHIPITKTKSSNMVTDIDVFFSYKDTGIVFQVKSKRLTELSKQGDVASVENDTEKAIVEAHKQGLKCIECVLNSTEYYSLRKNGLDYVKSLTLYNVCITLDAFPGISSLSFLKSYSQQASPIIAMSLYDLDIIFYLFQPEQIVDYFQFREQSIRNAIYGISEIYYIGAYFAKVMGYCIKLSNNKIPREYALYSDYIIKKSKIEKYRHKDIDCNLLELLAMFPVKEPIECK